METCLYALKLSYGISDILAASPSGRYISPEVLITSDLPDHALYNSLFKTNK